MRGTEAHIHMRASERDAHRSRIAHTAGSAARKGCAATQLRVRLWPLPPKPQAIPPTRQKGSGPNGTRLRGCPNPMASTRIQARRCAPSCSILLRGGQWQYHPLRSHLHPQGVRMMPAQPLEWSPRQWAWSGPSPAPRSVEPSAARREAR
eukprot:scaffold17415_cov147-Isochrysis_galbana.AAC.1